MVGHGPTGRISDILFPMFGRCLVDMNRPHVLGRKQSSRRWLFLLSGRVSLHLLTRSIMTVMNLPACWGVSLVHVAFHCSVGCVSLRRNESFSSCWPGFQFLYEEKASSCSALMMAEMAILARLCFVVAFILVGWFGPIFTKREKRRWATSNRRL